MRERGCVRRSARVGWILLLVFSAWRPLAGQPATPAATRYLPLTASQRWSLYKDDTWLAPDFYIFSLAAAAGSQAVSEPPEWGQGARGYGRRLASWIGVSAIEETVHHGGAALLGYDPRYLRCDCTGFFRRSGHAVMWSFVTKDHAGRTRLDLPSLAGAYSGGMLSTYWYPRRYQPLTDGVRAGHQELGFLVAFHLIDEFAPELKRFFTREP